MKTIIMVVLLTISTTILSAPVGSRFSYQGQLQFNDVSVTGIYDFKVELWNQATGGGFFGPALFINGVNVEQGIFSLELDFTDVPFTGDDRYLKIQVKESSSTGGYTSMYPKQRINATPYAIQADYLAANGATNGQVLKFDGTSWVAGTDDSSASPWQSVNGGTRFINGNVAIGGSVSASGSTLLLLDADSGDDPLRIKINGATKMRLYDNGGTSLGGNSAPEINGLVVQGNVLARSDLNVDGKMQVTGDSNVAISTLTLDGGSPLKANVNGLTKLIVAGNGGTALGGGSGSLAQLPTDGLYVAGDVKLNGDLTVVGKPKQDINSHGFAKAGLKFLCGFSAVSNLQSFNNVNSGVLLVTHSTPNYIGQCTITFPFDISNSFIQTDVDPTSNLFFRKAICRQKTGSTTQLSCRVSNPDASSVDSIVSLLVF